MAITGVKVGDAIVTVQYDVDNAGALTRIEAFKKSADALVGDLKVRIDVDQNHLKNALSRMFTHGERDVDVHSQRWGHVMARNISRGVDAAISLLPGRMEALFSGRGGPIGLAIGGSILAGLAGVMPAIGAMLSGALFAGLGTGVVAAGIALVAKDPRVVAAANRLKEMFNEKIWNAAGAEAYVRAVVPALDKITSALERWSPLINSILITSSRFVKPLTDGLIAFVDGFLGPLERLMKSPFMTQIMNTLGDGLRKVGEAFGYLFDRFLNDADAQQGAVMGLSTLFNLLAFAIRFTADTLAFLSATWKRWNDQGGDGKSFMDHVRDVFHALGAAIRVVAGIIVSILRPAFSILKSLIEPLWPVIKKVAEALGGALYAAAKAVAGVLREVADWLKSHKNEAELLATAIGTLVAALVIYKGIIMAIQIATKVWAAAQAILNAVMYANPIGLIILAIVAIVVAIVFVIQHLEFFKNLWNTVWGWIKAHAIAWWNFIFQLFSGWIQNIINWWNNSLNFIQAVWDHIWSAVVGTALLWWNFIFQLFSGWVQNIINWWNNSLNFLRAVWDHIWSAVVGTAIMWWNFIFALFSGWVQNIINWWHNSLNFLHAIWNTIWNSVAGNAIAMWNYIFALFSGWVQNIQNWWNNALNWIHSLWNTIWNSVAGNAIAVWNYIFALFTGWLQNIQNWWNNVLNWLHNLWNTIWTAIKDFGQMIWDWIKNIVETSINWVRDTIERVMNAVRAKWNEIWEGIKNVLGGIWAGIVNAVKSGINSVIDILNSGINAINGVLDKIGIGFRIPGIPKLADGGPVSPTGGARPASDRPGFAHGGKIRGPGTERSDSVPIWASHNEFMINARAARRLGYRNLAYMNKTGMYPANHRYAAGGRVGGNNNALLEAHRDHVHVAMNVPPMGYPAIIQKAATSGLPFRVSSTYRPGSRGSGGGLDHHSTGRAVDFGGYNQDAFASWWEHTAGVIELIHRTASRDYAIFGGGGGGLLGLLAKGIGWIMDHMLNPVINALLNNLPRGTLIPEMARGVVEKMREGLKAKIQTFIDQAAARDAGGGGGGGAGQWAQTATVALQMLGLPGSWLGPLLTLIGRESGGNPRAINLTDSNAMRGTPSIGLMQTIGPTFNAYKLPGYDNIYDPLSNILAGLRYIIARYGSIFSVQQAVGSSPRGYRNGGWLMPGGYAYNETDEPEAIFNKKQLSNIGHGMHIDELHIHIGGNVSDAEAKRIAQTVRNELVKLSRRNGGKTGLPNS